MSKTLVAFLVIWLGIVPAWAEVAENDIPPVLKLFDAPALELGVSKELTLAIASVESNLSPWVLNVEGQPFRFDSKEKALVKAGEAWIAGRSFDLGLMQINSQWLRRFDISLEAALDPLANVYFGTWLLKQEIDRHGDLRAAIGAYHSPKPARANRYADKVMAALKRGPQPAKRSIVKSQNAESDQLAKAQEKQNILEPMTPTGSGMLVSSQKTELATPGSMKAADTLPENSMKIGVK